MKKLRRSLAIFLSLLMVFSASPMWAFAEDGIDTGTDEKNPDITWVYDYETDSMTISGSGWFSGLINGVDFIESYQPAHLFIDEGVLGIGDGTEQTKPYLFSNIYLETVELPDSFDPDFQYTFNGCTNLTSVRLPKTMATLWENMFRRCSKLTTVELPNAITSVGNYAFYSSTGLISIVLPESVQTIGKSVFSGCSKLQSVHLPQDLKEIPEFTFNACKKLTEVNIPEQLQTIGKSAFNGCNTLQNIQFPQTLTEILENAFINCSALQEIILPEHVMSVGNSAFSGCTSVTTLQLNEELQTIGETAFIGTAMIELTIPASVASIGENAFTSETLQRVTVTEGVTEINGLSGCPALQEVQLPSTLKSIAEYAFGEDAALEHITIPDGTESISHSAFAGCESLQSITIPDSVTSIGEDVFYGCNLAGGITLSAAITEIPSGAFRETKITELILPDTVTAIGDSAFASCEQLRTVQLPNSVTTMGVSVFESCKALESVQLPNQITEIASKTFYGCASLQSIELPDSVKTIGGYAFHACKSLQQIQMNQVSSIGESAFSSSGLTSLLIPSSMVSVDRYAFAGCASLQSVTIKEGLCSLEERVFVDCPQVTEYNLPRSLKTIPAYSVAAIQKDSGCFYLDTVTIKAPNSSGAITYAKANKIPYKIVIGIEEPLPEHYIHGYCGDGDWVFDTDQNTLMIDAVHPSTVFLTEDQSVLDIASLPIENIVFLTHTMNIPEKMFEGFTGIKTVTMAAVSSVGDSAFAGCTALEKVSFSSNLKTIGNAAFYNCTALTTVDGLKALQTIDASAFENCKSLTGISFGDKMETIGQKAFYNCKSLTSVSFGSTLKTIEEEAFRNCTALRSIVLPDSVTALSKRAFMGCTGATGIEIGSGVTAIPDYCFADCTSLKDLTLSDALTSIGIHAFENAVKLVFLQIPDGVTQIGAYAFANCLNVEKITLGQSVSDVADYAFDKCVNCYELNLNSAIRTMPSPEYPRIHIEYYCGLKPVTPSLRLPYKTDYKSFMHIGENTQGLTVNVGDHVESLSLFWLANQTDMLTTVNIGSGVSRVAYKDNSSVNEDNSLLFASQFVGNPNLKTISVSADNPYLYSDGTGLYAKDKSVLYAAATGLESYEVKADTVSEYAFAGNTQLKKISFASNVTTISDYAFRRCTNLRYVFLPKSLQTIGAYAFEGCTAIRSMEIPNYVTEMKSYAFSGCTKLASVILSEKLTAIASYVFSDCTSLTGIVIPDSVTKMGQGAFRRCAALSEVYIGGQPMQILSSSTDTTHVFANCPALTIYTMAGSDISVYAKTRKIPCVEYTDADTFADLCAMKTDIYAGYLGFCTDGHGDIQWLTVYEADCENDGYSIGVCEYCSEILEEKHISASGHNYRTTRIEPTQTTDGIVIQTCANCGRSQSETIQNLSGTQLHETHTVKGCVVLASDQNANEGKNAAIGADIIIDGHAVATTDKNGNFSLEVKSGIYKATVHYAYGFDRTIYLMVSDQDVDCGSIPIIGCDWNKDGKIDDADYTMFKLIFNSYIGQPAYLDYVDMNHDGYINVRDMVIVERCMGIDIHSYVYDTLTCR